MRRGRKGERNTVSALPFLPLMASPPAAGASASKCPSKTLAGPGSGLSGRRQYGDLTQARTARLTSGVASLPSGFAPAWRNFCCSMLLCARTPGGAVPLVAACASRFFPPASSAARWRPAGEALGVLLVNFGEFVGDDTARHGNDEHTCAPQSIPTAKHERCG